MRSAYTEDKRAEALAVLEACAGNVREAARVLKMPRSTLRYWTRVGAAACAPEAVEEAKQSLAQSFEDVAERAVGLLTTQKLEEASAQQLVIVAGVALDKHLLLTGRPTARVEHTAQAPIERPGVLKALNELARLALPGPDEVIEGEARELGATRGQARGGGTGCVAHGEGAEGEGENSLIP